LARRPVPARPQPTQLRQAAAARLARCGAGCRPVEWRGARTIAAAGCDRRNQCQVYRGLSTTHRRRAAGGGLMRIAPEGWPFIIVAALMTLAPALAGWWITFVVMALLTIWVIAFFRDPVREGPRGDNLIIAPADGKIVSIIPIDEPDVLGGQAVRISIFMNVFNVHVNRYPATGIITFRRHRQGKFVNAATEKAALENEQSDVGIRTPRGPM